jgi:hypothetical protein
MLFGPFLFDACVSFSLSEPLTAQRNRQNLFSAVLAPAWAEIGFNRKTVGKLCAFRPFRGYARQLPAVTSSSVSMLHGAQKNKYIVPLLWWGGAAWTTLMLIVLVSGEDRT